MDCDAHVEVPENIVTGKSSRMIESRRPKKSVEHDERSSSASGKGSRERQEHDGHVPFTSCGPRGCERKLVRDNSIGLVFDYIAMEGSDDLWILSQNGVLSFNIRHPDWVAVESSDRKVMALQEFCALQALAACCLSDDARASIGEFIDLITHGFVSLLRASPAYGAKTQQKEIDPE